MNMTFERVRSWENTGEVLSFGAFGLLHLELEIAVLHKCFLFCVADKSLVCKKFVFEFSTLVLLFFSV